MGRIRDLVRAKMEGEDVVSIGVNIVVGLLLVGAVVGAVMARDAGVPRADLEAALADSVPDDASGNETAEPLGVDAAAPAAEPDAEEPSKDEEK